MRVIGTMLLAGGVLLVALVLGFVVAMVIAVTLGSLIPVDPESTDATPEILRAVVVYLVWGITRHGRVRLHLASPPLEHTTVPLTPRRRWSYIDHRYIDPPTIWPHRPEARTVAGIGISRRELLRRSLGAGVLLVIAEWAAGTLGFLWPKAAVAALRVRVGTLADLEAANPALPVADGFPAYVAVAKAFVVLVEPGDGFRPGSDATGTGAGVNVIALSQRCPHLGCRPEPVPRGLVDALSVPPVAVRSPGDQGGRRRPTGPRRAAWTGSPSRSSDEGVLTIDTSRIILGPLPIALGQPGVIPPRVEHGCI